MSGHPEVLCVGVASRDTIALVERMPASDERVVADDIVVAGGGPAATAAVTLARLGVSVGFSGVVGGDAAGKAVIAELESEGVDLARLVVDDSRATTTSVVLVERDSGARSIVTSASSPPPRERIGEVSTQWLHADQTGCGAAIDALAPGVKLSLDDGNRVPDLDLARVSLYVPTMSALLARYPGDATNAALAARRAGAGEIVVTAGAGGAYLLDGDGLTHVPSVPVDVVSTLGAGDVFHGALLAAVVRGLPLPDAVGFAATVAALSCRALDGRSGIPSWSVAENFIAAKAANVETGNLA